MGQLVVGVVHPHIQRHKIIPGGGEQQNFMGLGIHADQNIHVTASAGIDGAVSGIAAADEDVHNRVAVIRLGLCLHHMLHHLGGQLTQPGSEILIAGGILVQRQVGLIQHDGIHLTVQQRIRQLGQVCIFHRGQGQLVLLFHLLQGGIGVGTVQLCQNTERAFRQILQRLCGIVLQSIEGDGCPLHLCIGDRADGAQCAAHIVVRHQADHNQNACQYGTANHLAPLGLDGQRKDNSAEHQRENAAQHQIHGRDQLRCRQQNHQRRFRNQQKSGADKAGACDFQRFLFLPGRFRPGILPVLCHLVSTLFSLCLSPGGVSTRDI